jgi:hypothetical protein
VAAVSANGTRGFSAPSAPFTLSVGMLTSFSFSNVALLVHRNFSVGRRNVAYNENTLAVFMCQHVSVGRRNVADNENTLAVLCANTFLSADAM